MAPKPGIVVSRRASSFSFAELGVEGRDAPVELGPLCAGVGDEQSDPRAQADSTLLVHQCDQEVLELPLALRRDKSSLQKDGAQLIDQGRPPAN